MQDKIIIDGIDVSNCDLFIDWYEVNESKFQDVPFEKVTDLPKHLNGVPLFLRKNLCDGYSCYCKENPNCSYKQLKRKEQECDKLKMQLEQSMYLSEGTLRLYSNRKNLKYINALENIERYINNGCGYYIPYGAIQIIQEMINEVKDGE